MNLDEIPLTLPLSSSDGAREHGLPRLEKSLTGEPGPSAAGLGLCFLQGHYEHARGTTSHYGRLYNWLFFNDGYQVEQHSSPGRHWTCLPEKRSLEAAASRWPAVLRWMESLCLKAHWDHELDRGGDGSSPAISAPVHAKLPVPKRTAHGTKSPPPALPGRGDPVDAAVSRLQVPLLGGVKGWVQRKDRFSTMSWRNALLDFLERMVLKSTRLQSFVLNRHEQAFRKLLPRLPEIRRIAIVGGGIFPRTAIILGKLLPQASITIIDASAANIQVARTFLDRHFDYVHQIYDGSAINQIDLIVLPLSFIGDRQEYYQRPTARAMLVHDWIWRRRGSSRIVSWPLLKRLNLVLGKEAQVFWEFSSWPSFSL